MKSSKFDRTFFKYVLPVLLRASEQKGWFRFPPSAVVMSLSTDARISLAAVVHSSVVVTSSPAWHSWPWDVSV